MAAPSATPARCARIPAFTSSPLTGGPAALNVCVMTPVRLRRIVPILALLVLTTIQCGDDPTGPPPVPGRITLVLASANDDDGAALIELDAGPVMSVGADSADVFTDTRNGRLRIVVARLQPGPLVVTLEVRDTAAVFDPVLLDVADAADFPRSSLAGYTVEVRK